MARTSANQRMKAAAAKVEAEAEAEAEAAAVAEIDALLQEDEVARLEDEAPPILSVIASKPGEAEAAYARARVAGAMGEDPVVEVSENALMQAVIPANLEDLIDQAVERALDKDRIEREAEAARLEEAASNGVSEKADPNRTAYICPHKQYIHRENDPDLPIEISHECPVSDHVACIFRMVD